MNTHLLGNPSQRLAIAALVAAFLLAAAPADAGVNRWTGGPLGDLPCSSLAVHPQDPDTVFAGTGYDVYRSRDGGRSWSATLHFATRFSALSSSIAIDPDSPSSVYAATQRGLFRSSDGGTSWTDMGPRGTSFSLAIDLGSPSRLYAGLTQGLFRSSDRGNTWTGALATSMYSLAVSAQNPSTIMGADYSWSNWYYYYPADSRVYRSTDNGTTWSVTPTDIGIDPGGLVMHPTNPAIVWAAAASGLYMSDDSAASWQRVPDMPSDFTDVLFDPRNASTMYASGLSGVFRSADGGASWRDISRGLNGRSISELAIDSEGRRLYAAGPDGVFSYQIYYGAWDLSAAADNRTSLLFLDASGANLRSFDESGHSGPAIVPPAGLAYTAEAIAVGSDGRTRILWSVADGGMALQIYRSPDDYVFRFSGPIGDWTAVDVSAAPDSTASILWSNPDGRTGLWRLDSSGLLIDSVAFGPFPGWLARAIAHGSDGRLQLLWTHDDGRVGLSTIDDGRIVSTYRFTPEAGWAARDATVAIDGGARILMAGPDDQIAVWSVSAAGARTIGPLLDAPADGQSAARLAAGSDGLTRVLWTSPDGAGTVYLLSLDGVLQGSFGLN